MLMNDFVMQNKELVGNLVMILLLSALVALIAINKKFGYPKAFVIAVLVNLLLWLLGTPLIPIPGTIVCAIIFMFLPKKVKVEKI